MEMYVEESDLGDYVDWEEPDPEAEYVLGMDASEGRSNSSDHTCITVYRREVSRIIQVAEWYGRIRQGEGGEVAFKIGMHFNCALINCERNLSGAVEYALLKYGYPVERLFQPQANHSVDQSPTKTFFWWSDSMGKRRMVDIMKLYLGGRTKLIGIRSAETLAELDGLQKLDNGTPDNGGRDRATATLMAVVADAYTEAALPRVRTGPEEEPEIQPGRTSGMRRHLASKQDDGVGVPEFVRR